LQVPDFVEYDILRADPGDSVEVDEAIAQIETDKVLSSTCFSSPAF
jgi:hypothetical protein